MVEWLFQMNNVLKQFEYNKTYCFPVSQAPTYLLLGT